MEKLEKIQKVEKMLRLTLEQVKQLDKKRTNLSARYVFVYLLNKQGFNIYQLSKLMDLTYQQIQNAIANVDNDKILSEYANSKIKENE